MKETARRGLELGSASPTLLSYQGGTGEEYLGSTLRKAGKAQAVGISNCFACQLTKANSLTQQNGLRFPSHT